MAVLEGYNIAFKIGGKTIAGRTQDDLTIAARTKESLTKDDQGAAQVAVTGHDITFRATGLVELGSDTSAKSFRNTMIANALKTGDRKSTPSELQSHSDISYAVFCLEHTV